MRHRFRFHASRKGENTWDIFEDEWHHILKVLRLSEGELIELSDGEGWVAEAVLSGLSKHKGQCEIQAETYCPRPGASDELTLGLGILKPQGIDEVLPGLVELGVSRLILIPFYGMDKSRVSDKLLDRWQRQIVAASKQAKTAWFPTLSVAKNLETFLADSREFSNRYLLDPEGEVLKLGQKQSGPTLAVVGSEGGWSQPEVEKFEGAGFQKLRIHSHILRATTAALATAAILRQSLATEISQ